MDSTSELVMLNGGLTVPLPALQIGWSLEARGITMQVHGELLKVIGPDGKPELTPHDVTEIKRWKFHLMALCAYVPPDGLQ